jgi:hypothetical protein
LERTRRKRIGIINGDRGAPLNITLDVMSNSRRSLLFALVFAAGALIGGGAAAWLYPSARSTEALANAAAAGLGNKLAVLESLRRGDSTNAVTLLETHLDGELVILGLLPDSAIDPRMSRAIARAAEYRSRFPYRTNDPTVDSAVAAILAKHRTKKETAK